MKTESLQATEEVAARGATHPRVTLNDIENSIGAVYYMRGHQLLPPEVEAPAAQYVNALALLTICIIVMSNGFTIIGKSAPASPENFDEEKGRKFAYEDAVRQIWPLMGFALRDRLHRDSEDFKAFERVDGAFAAIAAEDQKQGGADLVGEDEQLQALNNENAADGEDDRLPEGLPEQESAPAEIPGDEELEALDDQPVKDLALAHGIDYVDRADAIAKLKAKRVAISGQANPL